MIGVSNVETVTSQPPKIKIDDTVISVWCERDRAHVELTNADTGATIIEWWDEAVEEAVEDGFLELDPPTVRNDCQRQFGKLHRSAYTYAHFMGLVRD
jgi:hypothetical protein